MQREFEIFKKDQAPTLGVKRGFSWPGFFFTWIWAYTRGLWLEGTIALVAPTILSLAAVLMFRMGSFGPIIASVTVAIVVGLKGNAWRSQKLEKKGYLFSGLVAARSAQGAVAAFARGGTVSGTGRSLSAFFSTPGACQPLVAVAWLTWKAAVRFRLFLVVAVLLLVAVVGLPVLIKDDGTARGFTQILLTYTLGSITALLGLSTLWLACGTLARDIEDNTMQVVAIKPVARWQIWLGKWLGIMSLNAALLGLSGASVYGLMQWRATRLPDDQRKILHAEVLVSRGSVKPVNLDKEIEQETDRLLQERLKKNPDLRADEKEARRQILEMVKAEYQVVPSGYVHEWELDMGSARTVTPGQPIHLRIKFNAADRSGSGTFEGRWRVGVPRKTPLWHSEAMSLAPDTFHEFEVPANIDDKGILTVAFANNNSAALLFPLDEGMEVLYRQGGFGLNFIRGLGIIYCWMALLAALGLASASFLSFPVAAFLSLGVLTLALSSGTIANVVSEGTLMGYNSETGRSGHSTADFIAIPIFGGVLKIINLAKSFSPIDSLSTGRSVSWVELARAFGQIVVLLGGSIGLFGIIVFSRRELATAQGA